MRRGFMIGCLMIALTGWSAPSRGDFVISIGSTSIAQGSTGTIDVMLSSTAALSSPDLVNNFAFAVQITGPGMLEFASSQDFSYLNASNYIFFGNSFDYLTSSPGGSTTSLVKTNDTFIGIDITNSGNPVSLSSSNTPVLLAALTLDTTSTQVGDSYTISLVPLSGNGSTATGALTYFDNYNFNTGVETSAVAFTSNSGTVTITAAVPEPSSIVLGLGAMSLLAGVRLATIRRRSKPQPARIRIEGRGLIRSRRSASPRR
jgi:hypothetical protein